MTVLLSMAAFALAASITPGPVNLVVLSSAARHGIGVSLRFVTGATLGFTLLLLLTGLGLHELLRRLPYLVAAIQWGGVAFLLYMAFRLALDDGRLGEQGRGRAPTLLQGAVLQWLNPKAWLAALAGMGAFAAGGETARVWTFTAIYFVICYASLACWSYAGAFLRRYLQQPQSIRRFNRLMALVLALSALALLLG